MRIFVTFTSSAWHRAGQRIMRQAKAMNVYDRVHGITEDSLDEAFRRKYGQQLVSGSRGFGYWCWKPQVILQILDQMGEGDVLQYTDAGCHLNRSGRKRLIEYFDMAMHSASGLLAFQATEPSPPLPPLSCEPMDLTEYRWVKGDLLDYFSVRQDLSITHTQSIGAGIIFVRKCEKALQLVKKWASVVDDGFFLLDDTCSKSPNLPGFIEHRHDQAIFSLLCKIHSVETLSSYEYWYPKRDGKTPDWNVLRNYPIHARRDKGISVARIVSKLNRVAREIAGVTPLKGRTEY